MTRKARARGERRGKEHFGDGWGVLGGGRGGKVPVT